jgi:uncharacterized membrane protein
LALDLAIILAALGITTLELVEAAAVAIALYGDSLKHAVFGYVALGIVAVLVPALLLGRVIELLPLVAIQVVGGGLLLYFGLRLVRSARRTVLRGRKPAQVVTGAVKEEAEKGIMYTAFSVGAIEAFEAAIVLIGLLPHNYTSTLIGLFSGIIIVIAATYLLRNQVRKIKQASMKVVVSALLLSFASFWFTETVLPNLSDLVLIPLFAAFALIVYWVANRPTPLLKIQNVSERSGTETGLGH